MSEKELQKEVFQYEEVIDSNLADLEKAYMALSELLNEYHWDYEPDVRKAIEYGSTLHEDENCDKKAKWSWEYINGYKKIMWLVSVAKDYCYEALESCNKALDSCHKAYCGGVDDE